MSLAELVSGPAPSARQARLYAGARCGARRARSPQPPEGAARGHSIRAARSPRPTTSPATTARPHGRSGRGRSPIPREILISLADVSDPMHFQDVPVMRAFDRGQMP